MDTNALRQKILDLAIRGKLVPQDPNDEPASVLLERIRQEKQQMVKEGKLKPKDIKNDTVIFKGEDSLHYEKFQDGTVKCIEDEIPFEVPEGWVWSRLGTLFSIVTGSTPSTKNDSFYGDEYPFYKPTDLDVGFNVYSSEHTVSEKGYQAGRILPKYSVLVTCIGATIGKTGYIRRSGICNQQINAILPNEYLSSEYTYFCMCSEFEQQQIWTNSSATTLPILNKSKFENLLFPVPSKDQQELIVDRIKELINFVEIIQAEQTILQEIIKESKSKIFNLAIRGKLVPQNSNDEPASVLLERIRAEKQELIKQGKIKRDKKESIIFKGEDNSYYEKIGKRIENIDDEIPFELPNGWTWCRFSEVIELLSGQDLTPDRYSNIPHGIPYIIGASNLVNGSVIVNRWTSSATTHATIGDLLLTVKGSGIGKMAICDIEDAHIARQIMALRCRNGITQEYLRIVVSAFLTGITDQANGIIPGIRREVVLDTLFPLPPSSEQFKISAKVSCIIEELQTIEKSLS